MKNYMISIIKSFLLVSAIILFSSYTAKATDFITPVNSLEEVKVLNSTSISDPDYTSSLSNLDNDTTYKIKYFINTTSPQQLVIVSKGSNQGVVEQNLFRSYRMLNETKVPTGTLKAIEVHPDYSIAVVLEDNLSSLSSLGKYTGVMANDLIEDYQRQIVKKQILSKIIEIPYKKLFQEYDFSALSMDLSEEGKILLKKEIQELLSNNISKILIESHSGNIGSFRSNQIESEQRANSIKYFLEYEFDIEGDRIVTIGLGKSNPKIKSSAINSELINRRIVIKAID